MLTVRYLRVLARRVFKSRAIVLLVLALQVLYLLPALGASSDPLSFERFEIENMRTFQTSEAVAARSTDGAVGPGYEDYLETPQGAWQHAQELEMAQAADRAVAAFDAGDMPAYFTAHADLLELTYQQKHGVDAGNTLARAAQYRALAAAGERTTYSFTGDMPAAVYAASDTKGLLVPFTPYIPLLTESDAGGSRLYNDACEFLFYLVLLLVVTVRGASLQARERLAAQLPAGSCRRALMASISTAALALATLGLVCLPGLVCAALGSGIGSLAYPVVFGSGTAFTVTTVGAVLAQTVAIYALIALAFSLAAHASAVWCGSVLPAAVLLLGSMVVPLFPGYFGRFSAFRDIAAWLPCSYYNVGYAVGTYALLPSERALSAISFANGLIALGIANLVLGIVLVMAAKSPVTARLFSRTRERRMPAEVRRAGWNGAPWRNPGAVASSSASAYARTPSALPSCKSGCTDPAARVRLRVLVSTGHRPTGFLSYTAALFRLMLSGPAVYAVAVLMALAFLVPAVFSLDPDVSALSASRYVTNSMASTGVLKRLEDELSSGAYAKDSVAYGQLERQRDLITGFIWGQTPAERFQSLASYDRYCLELHEQGSNVLMPDLGGVAFDPVQTEARARMAEQLAALDDPELYSLGTRMPGGFYLSFVYGAAPFALWLIPAVTSALLVARRHARGSLIRQAPVSPVVELAAGCLVAFVLAITVLAIVVVPGTAVATARNGIGDLGYPVVYVQNGAVIASTVLRAILSGAALQALVSAAAVVFLMAVAQMTRSWRAVCGAAVLGLAGSLLAMGASALAPSDGLLSLLLGWFPLTYLDVASIVGAAGYTFASGAGISMVAGMISLAISLPVMVIVSLLTVRVRQRRYAASAQLNMVRLN